MADIETTASPTEHKKGGMLRNALTPHGHPLDTSQPVLPVFHRKFANPAPLGLMAFATTTLLLSFINVNTRGVTLPNIVVALAMGYGGIGQLLAGMWEGACGNTFGFTAFSSYGCFWIAYCLILLPSTGIVVEYEASRDQSMLSNAIGLFLAVWFIVTLVFLLASLRSSVGLIALFFFLSITFLLLTIGELRQSSTTKIAGGSFGIITSFIAYYDAAAGLLTPDTSIFVLPIGDLSKRDY